MWSEHCSYKNSIKWLKTLPRDGERLLVKAGEENAGLVDIGDAEEVGDQHAELRDLLGPPDRSRKYITIDHLHHRQHDHEDERRHRDPKLDKADRRENFPEYAHRAAVRAGGYLMACT